MPPSLIACRALTHCSQVACQTIAFGRGVCGAAASTAETQLVPDVEEFPGHIACDGDSQSEIVVPILHDGKVRLSSIAGKCLLNRTRWLQSSILIVL